MCVIFKRVSQRLFCGRVGSEGHAPELAIQRVHKRVSCRVFILMTPCPDVFPVQIAHGITVWYRQGSSGAEVVLQVVSDEVGAGMTEGTSHFIRYTATRGTRGTRTCTSTMINARLQPCTSREPRHVVSQLATDRCTQQSVTTMEQAHVVPQKPFSQR